MSEFPRSSEGQQITQNTLSQNLQAVIADAPLLIRRGAAFSMTGLSTRRLQTDLLKKSDGSFDISDIPIGELPTWVGTTLGDPKPDSQINLTFKAGTPGDVALGNFSEISVRTVGNGNENKVVLLSYNPEGNLSQARIIKEVGTHDTVGWSRREVVYVPQGPDKKGYVFEVVEQKRDAGQNQEPLYIEGEANSGNSIEVDVPTGNTGFFSKKTETVRLGRFVHKVDARPSDNLQSQILSGDRSKAAEILHRTKPDLFKKSNITYVSNPNLMEQTKIVYGFTYGPGRITNTSPPIIRILGCEKKLNFRWSKKGQTQENGMRWEKKGKLDLTGDDAGRMIRYMEANHEFFQPAAKSMESEEMKTWFKKMEEYNLFTDELLSMGVEAKKPDAISDFDKKSTAHLLREGVDTIFKVGVMRIIPPDTELPSIVLNKNAPPSVIPQS